MKQYLLFFAILCAGCAGSVPMETYVAPKLINQEPFPALPQNLTAYRQDFHIKLQVNTDGSVNRVELGHWSGDAAWDSAAVEKIRRWQFTPALYNGTPVKLWIDLHACVKCAEPVMMGLLEIICPTKAIADTVYAQLLHGEDFERLASLYSIAASRAQKGRLGEVDVNRFPDEIQSVVSDLKINEYSKPLPLGSYFCLYKRVPWDVRVP